MPRTCRVELVPLRGVLLLERLDCVTLELLDRGGEVPQRGGVELQDALEILRRRGPSGSSPGRPPRRAAGARPARGAGSPVRDLRLRAYHEIGSHDSGTRGRPRGRRSAPDSRAGLRPARSPARSRSVRSRTRASGTEHQVGDAHPEERRSEDPSLALLGPCVGRVGRLGKRVLVEEDEDPLLRLGSVLQGVDEGGMLPALASDLDLLDARGTVVPPAVPTARVVDIDILADVPTELNGLAILRRRGGPSHGIHRRPEPGGFEWMLRLGGRRER